MLLTSSQNVIHSPWQRLIGSISTPHCLLQLYPQSYVSQSQCEFCRFHTFTAVLNSHQFVTGFWFRNCVEHPCREDPQDWQAGQEPPMHTLFQIIWQLELPVSAHEDPQRTQAIHVWLVQEALYPTIPPTATQENTHRCLLSACLRLPFSARWAKLAGCS